MSDVNKMFFLKHKILKTLSPLIDNEFIVLDFPYHCNIGDSLIWKGTMDFINDIGYKCLMKSSFQTFNFPQLNSDIIILLHGGGNFGDLYVLHHEFKKKVVKEYPNNKIIILPQTIYYECAYNARWDAHIFRQHNNLIICARDMYSYRFLKAYGFCKNVLLIPDMAFCINREDFDEYIQQKLYKDLLLKRKDIEKSDVKLIYSFTKEYDVSDWPLFEEYDPLLEELNCLIKEKKYKEADEYAEQTYLPNRIKIGVEFISKYDRIFSNRLHGSILSLLLGKDVYIIDNSYGKNSQYYNTWLKDIPNVHLLTSSKNISFKRKVQFSYWWLRSVVDRILGF